MTKLLCLQSMPFSFPLSFLSLKWKIAFFYTPPFSNILHRVYLYAYYSVSTVSSQYRFMPLDTAIIPLKNNN